MPRTLNPILEAALDSRNFQPYFLVTVREVGFSNIETATPVMFSLEGTNLTVKWVKKNSDIYDGGYKYHELEFKITRGVNVQGTNYTIDSSWYYGVNSQWDGIYQTVQASLFPKRKYTAAGDVTYKTVIDTICSNYGKTAVYKTIGAAWQSYKFLGTGKILNLNNANDLFKMLKQKYLIIAADIGNNEILFKAITSENFGSTDHTLSLGHFKDTKPDIGQTRRYLWRDETNATHYAGEANDPIWNLGYLESTANPPTTFGSFKNELDPIPIHLKYLEFDAFDLTNENYPDMMSTSIALYNTHIIEIFNPKLDIPWQILLSTPDWGKGTEGGALPVTTEAAVPYTPLNVSSFSNVLSSTDNNIQAAMETIDDHDHGGVEAGLADHLSDTTNVHAYTSLSAKPAAETNTNFIFACTSPGGTSAFTGTIATLPGGATLTYNVSTGTEGAMVPNLTTNLAKMRLYNTTRGTSALISNCVTGTNTLTLTANVPGGWQVGDAITIASQTVTGAPVSYVDLEITSGPTNKLYLFVTLLIISATAGDNMRLHPTETYAASKQKTAQCPVTNLNGILGSVPMKITSNVISLAWTGTPTNIFVIEDGYLE